MRWLLGLLLVSALCIAGTTFFANIAHGTPVNLTEHSWIYSSGFITDQRIYQTESGYHGQKAVTGTRGSGVVSRTIDAQVSEAMEMALMTCISMNGASINLGRILSHLLKAILKMPCALRITRSDQSTQRATQT